LDLDDGVVAAGAVRSVCSAVSSPKTTEPSRRNKLGGLDFYRSWSGHIA